MSNAFSVPQIRHLMRVEFSRAQRYGYPLSCLVLGCDRLDHLRDLHGIELKERVLDGFVELLVDQTRTCDYLGHLTGDRLLAVLPHTGREGAETVARRMLDAARARTFESAAGPVRVTLSVGLSHYEDDNTLFFDSLIAAAETAMARAAADGGDRMHHLDPGPVAQSKA